MKIQAHPAAILTGPHLSEIVGGKVVIIPLEIIVHESWYSSWLKPTTYPDRRGKPIFTAGKRGKRRPQ